MDTALFEKNMSALEAKYPALASRIKVNSIEENRYKVVRSQTEEPNLVVTSDNNFIMLYDNASPYEHCKIFFEGMNVTHGPVVLFLGFGLGYHLFMFMQLYGEKASTQKIIVFEADIAIFQLAMGMIDLSPAITHPDIHFFVGEDPAGVFPQLRKGILSERTIPYQLKSVKVVPLPAHILLNNAYYRKVLDTARLASRQIMILAGNDPTDAFVGMDNLLSNAKNIVSNPGINLLKDKFKGRPAVTVAAGPSLEKNMHLLRDIRERAFIISCDASFLPLMKRDIRPHMVVSLERTDGTEKFYESAPDHNGVYLAACPLVRPRVYDSFRGKKLIVYRPFSHFDWFHVDKGALSIGPAVSNMAFKIAEYLGCDPIIMIGQDLAFAEDGDTHAKDMMFGERDEYYYASMIEVEGNDGRPIKTSRTWEIFKAHHEEDISSYKGLCINATEGGAKVRGAQVMNFADAIQTYCGNEFFPEEAIADSIADFEENVNIRKELKAILDRSRETRRALEETINGLLEYRKEIIEIIRDLVHPFMYEGADVDSKRLLSAVGKFVGIVDSFLNDQNVNDIMLHTVQPQLIWFNNRFNHLPEIYTHEDCLHAARIMMIKDWLGVIGQLFVSTIDSLERTEKMIISELERAIKIA